MDKILAWFKTMDKRKLLRILFAVTCAFFVGSVIVFICKAVLSPSFYGRWFSDFAEVLEYCIVGNPYKGDYGIHAIYPPVAFLPFYLFALIAKRPVTDMMKGENGVTLENVYTQPLFVLAFVLYFVINMALILLIVWKMSKLRGWDLFFLLASVTLSGAVLYTFMRGNVIITTVLFGLLFFWLYRSPKRWQREVSLVCLAMCIAMKIFPAFIIIFFLKDRKWLDILKTLGYSLVLIFIPFLFIKGGFNNIPAIWGNFTHFNSGEGRQDNHSNISFDSFAANIASLLSLIFGGADLSVLYGLLSKLFRFGGLAVAVVCLILGKKSTKSMQVLLVAICTYQLFQGVSYGYVILFSFIPFLEYLEKFDESRRLDKWYYGACYFVLFAVPLCYAFKWLYFQKIALICLLVKAMVDLFVEFHRGRMAAKKLKESGGAEKNEPASETLDSETEKPEEVGDARAEGEATPAIE